MQKFELMLVLLLALLELSSWKGCQRRGVEKFCEAPSARSLTLHNGACQPQLTISTTLRQLKMLLGNGKLPTNMLDLMETEENLILLEFEDSHTKDIEQ